jgi:hypothetical protein
MQRDIKSEMDETVQVLRDTYYVASQNNEKEIVEMLAPTVGVSVQ